MPPCEHHENHVKDIATNAERLDRCIEATTKAIAEIKEDVGAIRNCVQSLKADRLTDRVWAKVGKVIVAALAFGLSLTGGIIALLRYIESSAHAQEVVKMLGGS